MNQLKYRVHTDVQTQLFKLKKTLRHQAQVEPKRGAGYSDAPKTWAAIQAQCKPLSK